MIKLLSRNWPWAITHPIRAIRYARACVATFPTTTNSQERQQ